MTINYSKIGKGNNIILLCHGFGESAFIWQNLAEKLSENNTILIPNLQGCNPSLLKTKSLTIGNMADDIHEIILKENIEKFSFLGHSMGGYIGLQYAKKQESYLNKLCLINSTAFADTTEKMEQRKKTNEFIANNKIEVYLKTSIPNLYGEHFKNANPLAIDHHIKEAALRITKQGLIAQNTAMIHREDSIDYLKQTQLPIQFIIGATDQVVPLQKSEEQASWPKNRQINILPNIGHMSFIETDISTIV